MAGAKIVLLFLVCLFSHVTLAEEDYHFVDVIDPYRGNNESDPRNRPDSYAVPAVLPDNNHFCSDYSKWCWKWCRNSAGGFTNYYCYISPYRDRRWIRCGNDGDCMAVWPCVTDCFKDK